MSAYQTVNLESHRTGDPNALYLVWLGSNDAFDILARTARGEDAEAGRLMQQSLGDIQSSLVTLVGTGARRFLLPSLPDIGLTPEVLALDAVVPGARALATAITAGFNAALDAIIADLPRLTGVSNLELMRFDAFGFLPAVIADAAAYGFTDTSDACTTGVFVTPPPTPGTVCTDPAAHLFWDQIHPSAAAHQYLAEDMFEVVPEPRVIALLGLGLVGLVLGRRRAAVVIPDSRYGYTWSPCGSYDSRAGSPGATGR